MGTPERHCLGLGLTPNAPPTLASQDDRKQLRSLRTYMAHRAAAKSVIEITPNTFYLEFFKKSVTQTAKSL